MATRDFSSSHQLFDSELSSVRPCHVLLEPLPSGCEANGSSVVQSRQDEVFDGPGEANSDSGDSLFITQKSVPEAVRSRKRRCSRLRPDSKTQHEDSAKQNAETSSSSTNSDEEPKTNRKKKKKILKVPKIRFSFLNKTSKMKPIITNVKHTKLQLYTMGGFFSSVHELWKSFELGSDLAESLPTVDMDGQMISPISEEDEETLEEEDLKVVVSRLLTPEKNAHRNMTLTCVISQERKHFVASLKASSSQPWSILNSSSNQRRRRISALNRSQIEQQRTVHKDSIKMTLKEMLSSDTESSDDGDALGRGLGTIRSSSPQEVSTTNIHTQTERPDTKSHLQKIKEQLLGNDSDTIKRDQEEQTAQIQLKMEDLCMDEQSQSESTACGFENQNTPQRDSGTLSSESKVKKRKKKDKSVKKGSQKPEGQHDVVPSGCVDITEEEITLINEQNTHASNRNKKKKKKKKSAHQEEDYDKREQSDEELEVDSVGSSKTGSDGKEKKKSDVGVACVKTSTACEHPTDDGNIKKKKKKKHLNSDVPQTSTEHHEHLENTEVSQESVESNFTKRKKKNKKKKKSEEEEEVVQQEQSDKELAEDSVCSSKTRTDGKEKKKRNDASVACVKTNAAAEPPTDDGNIKKKKKKKKHLNLDVPQTSTEHHAYLENTEASQESMESKFTKKKKTSAFDTQIGEGDRIDVDISNDPATLETDADLTVKKKKKKKKRGISETEYISHYAEEDKNIGNTQKEALDAEPKTKKKKMKGNSSKIIQEKILAPVKYSVSVQKKKRKTTSSFLTADEEGKKGHTHKKHPPDVSIDTLAATSADVSLSLGESKDRSKKKKKRRSAGPECLEKELEFKEPKETSEPVVKKKKKHKRNDSKLMSSTEMSESLADAEGSQTDEAVVLSKKKKKYTLKRRETIGQHDSLPANKPGNQMPKEKKKKKKGNTDIKHLLKVKSLTKTITSKKRTEPAAVSSFNLTPSDKFFSKPETSSVRQKK